MRSEISPCSRTKTFYKNAERDMARHLRNGDYNFKTINPNNPDDDDDDAFMNEIDIGVSIPTPLHLW